MKEKQNSPSNVSSTREGYGLFLQAVSII